MIKKYIKRPYVIEAVQWGRNAINLIDGESFNIDDYNVYFDGKEVVLIIPTLEGNMKCYPGDYIVKGIDGEYYPVKKEIFEKTYVEVKDEDDEFISVRKDRLEEMVESAYDDSSFCPLVKTTICKWKSSGSCLHCKYDYADIRQENETVKNVIQWLEGEENE